MPPFMDLQGLTPLPGRLKCVWVPGADGRLESIWLPEWEHDEVDLSAVADEAAQPLRQAG